MAARPNPEVVLMGNCGPKALRVLKAAGIKAVVGRTVIEYDNHTEAAAALRQIWQKVSSTIGLRAA
jgi:predicted Fe-Mo cluster-binding NifX family protein